MGNGGFVLHLHHNITNMREIIWSLQNFLDRIKHTWKWTKLGWGFHPTYFEYTDTYKVLKFSLERMVESFEVNRHYYKIGYSELQYMRLCIKLIDRLDSSYYEERGMEELEKRWGKFEPWEFKPYGKELTTFKIRRENEKIEQNSERYNQDLVETYNRWAEKHKKARKLLFRILNEKLEMWWI